jgi:hypothetical protein
MKRFSIKTIISIIPIALFVIGIATTIVLGIMHMGMTSGSGIIASF